MLRYVLRPPRDKIILRHVLSEFTKFVYDDHKICHKIARHVLRYAVSVLRIGPLSGVCNDVLRLSQDHL